MKQNPIKRALREGKPSIGTWLSMGDMMATRLMARVGFQWLTLDIEHSPIDWAQAAALFGAVADAGCVPLARVPCGSHDHIKRALDGGAHGIVVPMVNTVEEARRAVAAAKYPPLGNRSVGGTLHALNFAASAAEYFAKANDEIVVVLMTEHIDAVNIADEIYSVPGIDAIFVGPADLGASMRSSEGQNPSPEVLEQTLQRILAAGKCRKLPMGIHVMSAADAQRRIKEGWQFIAVGSELRMMTTEAQRIVQEVIPESVRGDVARY